MYDTAAVLIDQPPRSILDSPAWQRERVTVDRVTGEQSRVLIGNHDGLGLTLLGDGRLKVERSLPKALTGQNVEDLSQADVGAAVEAVDREVARAFRTLALPSVAEASPVRVDYCESRALGSEDAVRSQLLRLATIELPRKGRPIRGDAGSVAWPRGAIRPKVYGKYLETHGSDSAYGVLRLEVGAYRLRTFRALLGRPATAPVRLLDALQEDVRAAVMGRYEYELNGGLAMGHELTDSRFLSEMLSMFGVRRTASLVGYALIWHAHGEPNPREIDVRHSPFGSFSTHYRVVNDFRRLREQMIAKGYDLEASSDDPPTAAVERFLVAA